VFEIVSDRTYSLTVNIRVQIVVDTSGFSYRAYKKYMQDPDYYDRRSEKKKIKNGMKLKLRHEFPVSTSKVVCAIISSMLSTPPTPATTPPTPTPCQLFATTPTTPTTLLYSYTNTTTTPTTTTVVGNASQCL
jgi:hypothetical protein